MSNLHVKYLLVGGGLASSAAAQAIRARDPAGSVLLVGNEISQPYHRPPLSKEYLRHEKSRAELFALEAGWFEKNHVELRTGRPVEHLDAVRRDVTLDSGEEVSFDNVLLATGGSPARLDAAGADLPGVVYLRTLEDADRLQMAVQKARQEGRAHSTGRGRVAVIGGGVLGVELAASFTQLGLAVDLVIDSAHPWAKFAGPNTGQFLSRFLEQRGIRIHGESRPRRLEGDGRVQRVVLGDNRSLDIDFVVPAVGMTVNKDLLRGTTIAAERAILTDDHCRTNVPGIWAAGDCAAVFDPLFGKHRLLDHWDNAMVTGTLAGRNMTGADEAYHGANYFFSDVFDLSLSGWGEARVVDRRLLRGLPNIDRPDFVEIGIAADGRVAQILAIGHKVEDDLLRDIVAHRARIENNEEKLKDPSVPLADLLL